MERNRSILKQYREGGRGGGEAMNSQVMRGNCIPFSLPANAAVHTTGDDEFSMIFFFFSGKASIERAAAPRSHGDES